MPAPVTKGRYCVTGRSARFSTMISLTRSRAEGSLREACFEVPLLSKPSCSATSSVGRSENMRRIRSRDSVPELAVRRLLFRRGYRYRLALRNLPGCPDIVFPGRRKVIFVHGCFWHVHRGCRLAHKPASNQTYWSKKLRRNVERDRSVVSQLTSMGWGVHVVWECETRDLNALAARLTRFLQSGSDPQGEVDA